VELDDSEDRVDCVRVNTPEPVDAPVGDLFKLNVRTPVGDKVATDEGLGCVDAVKPSEGDAKFVTVTLGVAEGNTVRLSIGDPLTEYDEVGVILPENEGVCELEGDCRVELVASIVVVPCVSVNKGLVEASGLELI